tara:strand:+ start:107 stop:1228 length:1122 start_codon:yes stop_codon:yes gene_type:complete
MKKNIVLIFFSLSFALLLVYSLVFIWVSVFQKYKDDNIFTEVEKLNFHKEYSNKIHHLRGNNWPRHKKDFFLKKEDYLFTVFSEFKNEKKNFLIQGDSWAEYMVFKDSINETLQKIANKYRIGLINSGISSFSPSPMKIQFKILEEEYSIKPDYLISIIDQTDIGDELCRYRHNIAENRDGTVNYIKREINTGAVMDASKYYSFSRIILEKKRFTNFHLTNYYFFKTFHELKTKLNYINKLGMKESNNYKCKFQQIQRYLLDLKNEDKYYFMKRTQEYFDFLNSKEYLKKVYIVTFPHANHLKKNYKVNVSEIINELNLNPKIVHVDFNDIIKNKQFKTNNIYEPNDPASHLNEETHKLYIKKIFEIIDLRNL